MKKCSVLNKWIDKQSDKEIKIQVQSSRDLRVWLTKGSMGGSLIVIEAGCMANVVTKEKLLMSTQAMCTKPFSAVPNFRFQNNFLFGINNKE